jgi:GntR family transcriptional regulator
MSAESQPGGGFEPVEGFWLADRFQVVDGFQIDAEDPMPIHAQLDRAIQFAILTGRLRVGDQLPTVRQLAVDLKINANTVAKVYGELERRGVLETRRGVGTFVREQISSTDQLASRKRRMRELTDRFLFDAAELGYSAQEAIDFIKSVTKKEGKDYA